MISLKQSAGNTACGRTRQWTRYQHAGLGDDIGHVRRKPRTGSHLAHLKKYLRILGPGLIAGSADDDPSGIGTYAIAGASLGYTTLWTALFTIPMMIAVQLTCAKLAMVTDVGLAASLRRHYPSWIVYPAVLGLFAANTVNA